MTVLVFQTVYKKIAYKPLSLDNFSIYLTNNIMDGVTTVKEKYKAIENILSITWLNDSTTSELMDNLYTSSKIYFGFLKLYNIVSKKYGKHCEFNEDLCGNSLLLLSSNSKVELYENKMYYNFRLSDLIQIINNALTCNHYFHVNPKNICNPFTNNPFSLSNLYNIYYKFKESNLQIPILFYYYYLSEFDLEVLATNYNYELSEFIVNNFVRSLTPNKMVKIIKNMIKVFKPILSSIIINETFPNDVLISAFKPFLKYYYITQNTRNYHKLYHIKDFLFRKLVLFNKLNPLFGRVVHKTETISTFDFVHGFDTKKCRKKVIHDKFVPFYKININDLSDKHVSKLWNRMDVDKIFNKICDHIDTYSSDYSDSDSDSDSTIITELIQEPIIHPESTSVTDLNLLEIHGFNVDTVNEITTVIEDMISGVESAEL